MKIFNWVHRRFNQKDCSSQNAKRNYGINNNGYDPIECDMLANNTMNDDDVFDAGWKLGAGILSIGTFGGYQPLVKDQNGNDDDDVEQKEDNETFAATKDEQVEIQNVNIDYETNDNSDDDDGKDQELNPLVYAVYAHDYDYSYEENEVVMNEDNEEFDFDFEYEFDEVMKKASKRRTTLAELFSADSAMKKEEKPFINENEKACIIDNSNNDKHGLIFSFPKKLIGGDHARPVQKLHRLMRRMLKKKIHPDVWLNKDINANNPKIRGSKRGINESASLLPTDSVI